MSIIKSIYKRRRMLLCYVGFLVILAVSVALLPFGFDIKEQTPVLMYISGAMFWVGLLGTAESAIYINMSRRKTPNLPQSKKIALISFFQNKPAVITDLIMFASVIGIVACFLIIGSKSSPYTFGCIALFMLSFGLHCMLNGKCFTYLTYKVRRVNENE